jgi:hypothetical protein
MQTDNIAHFSNFDLNKINYIQNREMLNSGTSRYTYIPMYLLILHYNMYILILHYIAKSFLKDMWKVEYLL